MELYNKYRPETLYEIYGNGELVKILEKKLHDKKSFPHAVLLTGPSGCGKTTIARIIKDALGCGKHDYVELDAGAYRSIDDVRDIRKQMNLKPLNGKARVWLLDEVHMLGTGGSSEKNPAQNALLKALEEAPEHVYFILATTAPNMLIKAIRTRCMEFKVSPLSERLMIELLTDIAKSEKKPVAVEVIEKIASETMGYSRLAINALDKIIDLDKKDQIKSVDKVISEENQAIDLCRALIKGTKWKELAAILKGLQEQEVETVRRIVLGYANSVLLGGDSARAAAIIREFQYPTYDAGWPQITAACYMLTMN